MKLWRCQILTLFLLSLFAVAGCGQTAKRIESFGGGSNSNPGVMPRSGNSAQMLLGNPSNAARDRTNYLISRAQYALSYNDSLRFPNWVSWQLVARNIGQTERGNFVPDPDLPPSFTRITTGDYTRTGYDRGHNCPSKDRSDTRQNNDIVFYMSNITPQAHGLNAGPWERLETYCRDLATAGNTLYITCGHGFSGGQKRVIGTDSIAVPDFAWKIIVVVPNGGTRDDRSLINQETRVIAVRMPNISTISKEDWQKYRVSPAEIEQATHLRFFDALPPGLATQLKNKTDFMNVGAQDRPSVHRERKRSSSRRRRSNNN